MGRHGGVVCAARVVMGPPPGLWRVHHTHTAVFSHATEVTSLRTTRTQGTVKRRYRVHTEPSLASNLCVTLPTLYGSADTFCQLLHRKLNAPAGGVFVIRAFRVQWRWHTTHTISATTGASSRIQVMEVGGFFA